MNVQVRRARPADVRPILALLQPFARRGLVLPRTYSQVVERVRDFWVAENGEGVLVGTAALHVVGEDLAEIRSLAVAESAQGRGVGGGLLSACLADARDLRLPRVFTLTYREDFFLRRGFRRVDKFTLPQKIWGDCLKCAKFSDCDEIAMIREISP